MKKMVSLLVWACLSTNAYATLGEAVDSVEKDRASADGTRRSVITRDRFTVQTIESDAAVIREYVSSSGIVFGLAWSGITHPNLEKLLGSYWTEYRKADAKSPRTRGRRSHQVKSARVVVQKWGHMRKLQGRAYDPALLPEGVSADEIN